LVRGGGGREGKVEEEATTRLPHQENQPAWDRGVVMRVKMRSTPCPWETAAAVMMRDEA
jgi:hypothetical protein